MSRWNGSAGKGFKKIIKAQKRLEAERRNAETTLERKSRKGKLGKEQK